MLPTLKKAILDSSTLYPKIISAHHQVAADQYELTVKYVSVVPHRWTYMSSSPTSNATIVASILKNGKTLHSTTKLIESTDAFNACERLQKISIVEGQYIYKWASTYMRNSLL